MTSRRTSESTMAILFFQGVRGKETLIGCTPIAVRRKEEKKGKKSKKVKEMKERKKWQRLNRPAGTFCGVTFTLATIFPTLRLRPSLSSLIFCTLFGSGIAPLYQPQPPSSLFTERVERSELVGIKCAYDAPLRPGVQLCSLYFTFFSLTLLPFSLAP